MKEIEIEIKVDDFRQVEERLKVLGAKMEKQLSMRDMYFNKEKFYRNIKIRLRRFSDTDYLFTVKSPKVSKAGVQIAEEKESRGSDTAAMYGALLAAHGKPIVDEEISVRKFVLGSAKIELREVKGLFNYLDIEAESVEKLNLLKKELNVKGELLKNGALNEVLKLRGLPEVVLQ